MEVLEINFSGIWIQNWIGPNFGSIQSQTYLECCDHRTLSSLNPIFPSLPSFSLLMFFLFQEPNPKFSFSFILSPLTTMNLQINYSNHLFRESCRTLEVYLKLLIKDRKSLSHYSFGIYKWRLDFCYRLILGCF